MQQAYTAISFLALAGLLAMYSIRFSKLSEAQYSRSVLPRHPSVLISLTGALVVLFALRAAYETLAASSVWSLPSFPPLRWSHAVFFLGFDLLPVLISLSLTARIPSQQAAVTLWEDQQGGAAGWESPAVAHKHSASALVRAQLLQPLTTSSTGSPQLSGTDMTDALPGTAASVRSGSSQPVRRGLHGGGGSEQLDYGVFASLYGRQQSLLPHEAGYAHPQSAPGGTGGLLASLAMPRVSSRESMRSTSSTESAGDTRLMLPGSYQAAMPAALQQLHSPPQRSVARSVGDVPSMHLGAGAGSRRGSGRAPQQAAMFSGSSHFNHPARYDMPIDDRVLTMAPQGGSKAQLRAAPNRPLTHAQAAPHSAQRTGTHAHVGEHLSLNVHHAQGPGRGALYAEDSPSAANLLG